MQGRCVLPPHPDDNTLWPPVITTAGTATTMIIPEMATTAIFKRTLHWSRRFFFPLSNNSYYEPTFRQQNPDKTGFKIPMLADRLGAKLNCRCKLHCNREKKKRSFVAPQNWRNWSLWRWKKVQQKKQKRKKIQRNVLKIPTPLSRGRRGRMSQWRKKIFQDQPNYQVPLCGKLQKQYFFPCRISC